MTTETSCTGCSDSTCSARQRRPGEREQDFVDRQALQARMCQVQHKVLVLSGKGGVGKSTVAVNLATALAMQGLRVGLLDVDIHGPSVPRLLRLEGVPLSGREHSLDPILIRHGQGLLGVMSIGFLLPQKDDAVVWRGPRKVGIIKQFLKDVEWGALDYLVVDAPPGTGDEPMAVTELIEKADGAVVVTTPQQLSVQDVRRCITFCRQIQLPVLGVVENMAGFVCPRCGELFAIFGADGGRAMAEEMDVPFLGSIPIEPEVVTCGDDGTPVVKARPASRTARALVEMVQALRAREAEVPASR